MRRIVKRHSGDFDQVLLEEEGKKGAMRM